MNAEEKLLMVSAVLRSFAEQTTDYDGLLETIVARVSTGMADLCTLQLLSDDGATLRPAAVHARDPALSDLVRTLYAKFPIQLAAHPGYRRAIETGEAVLTPVVAPGGLHIQANHRDVADEIHVHSAMLVPLRLNGQSIGALAIARVDPARRSFSEHDLELARILADHAALAISNARLLRAARDATALANENRRMQEASRLKSEFLANMSHELRTPLNSIIGFGELVHDEEVGVLSPRQKEFVGHMLTSGRHLLNLINDVLDLSKIEAGKMSFRPEEVDVRALLREVTAILQRTAATREVTLSTRVDDSIGNLVIDPGRLKQILYNFISNALKFTAPGGAIEVRIRDDGPEHFMIEVEDSGIGIAASDLPRLFVEFQQLDAGTAKKHAGTGLGLALTRRLVEAQGGQVGVTSSPGTGSTFHASLPRRAAARRTSAPVFEPTDQARSSVLVVDDADDGRTAIVTALREAGYVVHTAASAAEAIARCKQHRYDAITLDLLLPDASGLDMLRSVREGPNRDAKVLVVTMVSEPEATAGFPVDGVLRKPVEPRALLAALRRLRVAPRRRGRVWIIDDDDGSLELMSATLQGLGLEGLCLASATAALDHLGRELPTAVVLDLLMPELDGFEFLGRFRDIEECRDIPVIVWTAKDLSEDEHERLRSIAQGVVAKGSGTGSRISQFFRELQHG